EVHAEALPRLSEEISESTAEGPIEDKPVPHTAAESEQDGAQSLVGRLTSTPPTSPARARIPTALPYQSAAWWRPMRLTRYPATTAGIANAREARRKTAAS